MNRNEAIAYIRSRSGQYAVTSHDKRMYDQLSKLEYLEELMPLIYDYMEPIFFEKTQLVQYSQINLGYPLASHKLAKLGFVHIDDSSRSISVENKMQVMLSLNGINGRVNGISVTDATLAELATSSCLKSIDFNGGWTTDQTVDLSNVQTLQFAFDVPFELLLSGAIKLPSSIKVLTLSSILNYNINYSNPNYSVIPRNCIDLYQAFHMQFNNGNQWINGCDLTSEELKAIAIDGIRKFVGPDSALKDKELIKNFSFDYQNGTSSFTRSSRGFNQNNLKNFVTQMTALDHKSTLHFPELIGYAGMIDILDDQTRAGIKIYAPALGFWNANCDSKIQASILNDHIDREIIPKCPKMKGMLFGSYMTLKGEEERYGHISTVRKASIMDGAYFMEIFT